MSTNKTGMPKFRQGRMRGPLIKGPRAKDQKGTILRLWEYMRSQKKLLLVIFSLVSGATLLNLAGPYLMGLAIDKYIYIKKLDGFGHIVLLMIVTYVGSAMLTAVMSNLNIDVAQNTVKIIRGELFGKIQMLPIKFFDTRGDGDLASRLTNDVDNISNTLTQSLTQLISSALMLLGVVVMMFILNFQLALVTVSTVPLTLLLTKFIGKYTRKFYKEQQKRLGLVNSIIEETMGGQKAVKAYGQEGKVIKHFSEANEAYKQAAVKAQILAGIMGPMMNMVNNFIYALIALIGGYFVIKDLASTGIVVAFLHYSRQFARPINQIAHLYNAIQGAIAGAERVFEILDEAPEVENMEKPIFTKHFNGEVAFHNVHFGYERETKILKDINLRARPGQTIALVGPTGAGKTTIINLLTRFYDIDEGKILIDGEPIQSYRRDVLRKSLGIVLQDTYLFSGTVMENIRYGRLTASDEEVIKAAKMANAHQFIKRLSSEYNTVLSQEGNNLSQGQRQLIAIARTILKDPDILILDEATSSVDTRTEMHIQQGLLKLMEGRTSFVIAHRLSTIRNADIILVIKDGRIIERGTHSELLQQRGFYSTLYTAQFKTKVS